MPEVWVSTCRSVTRIGDGGAGEVDHVGEGCVEVERAVVHELQGRHRREQLRRRRGVEPRGRRDGTGQRRLANP
jgi:hypothetical protein